MTPEAVKALAEALHKRCHPSDATKHDWSAEGHVMLATGLLRDCAARGWTLEPEGLRDSAADIASRAEEYPGDVPKGVAMSWAGTLRAALSTTATRAAVSHEARPDDGQANSGGSTPPTPTAAGLEKALLKAARDFVWTLFARCQHDFEGHALPAIERYLVRRWSRAALARSGQEERDG